MKNHGILAFLRVSLYKSNMCIRLVESIWDEEIDKDQFNKNHNISKWNRVISGIAYFVQLWISLVFSLVKSPYLISYSLHLNLHEMGNAFLSSYVSYIIGFQQRITLNSRYLDCFRLYKIHFNIKWFHGAVKRAHFSVSVCKLNVITNGLKYHHYRNKY